MRPSTRPSICTNTPKSATRRHDALDEVAGLVLLLEGLPVVGLELLDRERNPAVLLVDRGDDGLDVVALLEDLGGVLDAARPRHVGDVDEAVDALFDLDERAEVGQVADLAGDAAADGVLLAPRSPTDRAACP